MTTTPPSEEPIDWMARNLEFIAQFRANGGRANGTGLLHTTGAKSGLERVNPLRVFIEGGQRYVFATNGGEPRNPGWYHNLLAHPDVTIEYDGETYEATATPLEGDEDARVRAIALAERPLFKANVEKSTRFIPIVSLVAK